MTGVIKCFGSWEHTDSLGEGVIFLMVWGILSRAHLKPSLAELKASTRFNGIEQLFSQGCVVRNFW